MNTFPALPGTVLRQYDADGDYKDTPIIGWQHVQGNMCFPVFPCGNRSVGPGSVLIIPVNEWVPQMFVHPSSQTSTEDEDEIKQIVADALGAAEESGEVAAATTKPGKAATPVQPDGKPDTRPIKFGAETYKTKSFWHWELANVVFEIEPENVIPKDPRVVKVKRDEYAKLKRDGAAKIDPHSGLIHGDTEDPTPEEAAGLKATATGFAPEDEDEEGMDLI